MRRLAYNLLKIFAVLALISLSGCSGGADQTNGSSSTKSTDEKKVDEVTIGVIYPLTGPNARVGQDVVNAAKLAAEDVNNAGGIKSLGGAKIKLEIMDAGPSPETARAAAESMIQSKSVSAILGAYSSAASMVVSEATERAEIPFITFGTADKMTARGFKYVFQTPNKASQYGQAQVEFAKHLVDTKGIPPKVAIVYENTAYGQTTSESLKKSAEKQGLQIVLFEPYEASFTDAGPLVTKIKSSGATILFPVSYLQDAILIQKTLEQMGVKIVVIGGTGYQFPDFYKAVGGKDPEGVFAVSSWSADLKKPELKDIAKRYQEKYHVYMTEPTGHGYVAVILVAQALEKAASTDPRKVRDALASLKIEPGQPGDLLPGPGIEFDETGWNKNTYPIILQWQDGVPRTVYPPEEATAQLR